MAKASGINIDSLSVQELTALIADAEHKRREKITEAKDALLAEMEEKAAQLGISLEALLPQREKSAPAQAGRKKRSDAGAPVSAKFRGPNGEEWSGRGRPPSWISKAELEGKNREEFRV